MPKTELVLIVDGVRKDILTHTVEAGKVSDYWTAVRAAADTLGDRQDVSEPSDAATSEGTTPT